MVAVYVRSFPFNSEKEMENFGRKQAEYEAVWRHTGEPLAVYEALQHANLARQPWPDWLGKAARGIILGGGRTAHEAERFEDRLRHFRRYWTVENFRRRNGPNIKGRRTKAQALDLAVAALEATGERASRDTIEDSYDLVSRDLKNAGSKSKYDFLVTRSKPSMVPVLVTRGSNGEVILNGVKRGVTIGKQSPPVAAGSQRVTVGLQSPLI
jgi:hypothetical protein